MVVSSTLTHYGNGLGPLLIGTGYVSKSTWWKMGLVVTSMVTVIYLTIGLGYWKLISLWKDTAIERTSNRTRSLW
ncbi:MAG: anion permease [Desulfitobacteriaceae bacterium]|nr:anion permease [Desulfitobacteriaceae bacterium]MDI6914064.1 anion permease [Desulfitobacteriaceae bacterium]